MPIAGLIKPSVFVKVINCYRGRSSVWQSAAMALQRSGVRPPSSPPILFVLGHQGSVPFSFMNQRAEIVILMGVAGSGKTTIGKLLAARLGYEFCDSDALHPPANVAKMSSRVPLTDEDRVPWLTAVRAHIV